MFEILLLAYLTYRNGIRAKQKGQNAIVWGIITAVTYFVGMMIGMFIVIIYFCKDVINLNSFAAMDLKARQAATEQLIEVFKANPLHMVTVELFGVGGYLLIRFILDRKPTKKDPEVHWMDKLGGQ
jgi:hypothetical protein